MTLSNIKKFKEERGFTIVELLIVIVIIAILAAIVIVAYNGITNRAKTSKALSAAQAVQQKAEAYNAEKGYYPLAGTDFGTDATKSYYVTGVTFGTVSASQANENVIEMAPCPTGATGTQATGNTVKYWDYTTPGAVTIKAGAGCP